MQRVHPFAEDPGRDSEFDQEVSCSSEGAWVEPCDPWGGTWEVQILREQIMKIQKRVITKCL